MEDHKNKSNPLISIIVPVYNVCDYVEKCIESIIEQTYYNLEIALVDDGSTDESGGICDRYAEIDERIVVYHKENGGLSDARNYALDRIHGDIIGFVDGDDWIHPQMYEIMLDKMIETGSDLVTCWFEQNDPELFNNIIKDKDIICKVISHDEAIIDIETPLVVAWNKLYKRFIFDEIRYPLGKLHEDEFIIHKVFHLCNQIAVIDNPLYFYTIREGSIVAKMNEKRIRDALEAFNDRIEYIVNEGWNGILPAAVKRYCDYCISQYTCIRNGVYGELDNSYSELLWNNESIILEKYPKVDMDKKYHYFAASPDKYYRYMKRTEVRNHYIELIKRMFRKVLKIIG